MSASGISGSSKKAHRAFPAQRLERALPLVPGPGPELRVREVDLVHRQDRVRLHAAHPTHLPTLRPCATPSAPPGPRGMVFAKNSDRPPGEIQVARPFGRRASAGCTLRTQYLTIGDTGAHATFLSSPTWLWGAEHGVNEHGVAIGNERVATTHDAAARPASAYRHGPGPPRARTRPLRRRGRRRHDGPARGMRPGGHRGRCARTRRTTRPSSSQTRRRPSCSRPPAPTLPSHRAPVAPPSRTGSPSAPIGHGPRVALAPGDDFGRFRDAAEDTRHADVRLAASRRFLAVDPSRRAHPGCHRRPPARPRHGAVGRAAAPRVPSTRHRRGWVTTSAESACACTCAARTSRAASMIAELPAGIADGAPVRVYVAPGSPCSSIYVPAFPRTIGGPPPFVPARALERGAVACRRRRATAGRGRSRRAAPRCAPCSKRSRTSCGPRPTRCSRTRLGGPTPAPRGAAGRCTRCAPHPLIALGHGGTLRKQQCTPTSPRRVT